MKQPPAKMSNAQYMARLKAAKAALRRHYCNVFAFWRACPFRQCRRLRACSGDANDCLKRRAAGVPHDTQWEARRQVIAATPANAGPPERMAREYLAGALAEGSSPLPARGERSSERSERG